MDPNAASGGPRRRNRGSRAGSASRPPSRADPDAASVGQPSPEESRKSSQLRLPDARRCPSNASASRREPTPREWLRFIEQMSGRRRGDHRALFPIPVPFFLRDRFPGSQIWNNNQLDMALEFTDLLLRQLSQASDSTAPPSLHPGAEGSGRRHVRQSVLYSNRPRRPQRRFSATEEHPSEVSSSELGGAVTGFPRLDDLSFSDASHLTPQIAGEETVANDDATEEDPREVSSSELGGVVTDLPTLDELSFSDAPHLDPQITGEETDDDDACSHLYGSGHVGYSLVPTGVTRSMRRSGRSPFFETMLDEIWERLERHEARMPDPNVDLEKLKRETKEFLDSLPNESFEEAFERIAANERKTLTALLAERGIEPPWNLVDQEAPSHQTQQEDPAAAAHPQDCVAVSHEASTGLIQDGKEWMRVR